MRAIVAAFAWLFAVAAVAQSYPARPVRIVIPFSPGGTTDTPGRILAQGLSEALGQQFFVDNRPGAGGTIGTEYVAKSKPDGHTLLLNGTPHVISANLYKNLPYHVLDDFTPIAQVAAGPYVLVVHPSLGVDSVGELIARAKAQPGKIDFASSGNGSAQHLVGALFTTMAGIDLTHVPYKGSGPATADLIAGVVKVGFPGTPIAIPHVRAGRLKALGVTTAARSSQMPDVPTIAEAGVPGFEAIVWVGVFAPAGTPRDVVARINGEVVRLLRTPEVQSSFAAAGVEPVPKSPDEFGAYVRSEFEKWRRVVQESGARVN